MSENVHRSGWLGQERSGCPRRGGARAVPRPDAARSGASGRSAPLRGLLPQPPAPLLLLTLLLAGCGSGAGGTGDVYVDHEHEHRPAHHPESFPAALAGLRVRLPAAAGGHARSRTEAAEIAGWLPELAADSDLSEAQWEPLAAGARELDALLPAAFAGDAAALGDANAALDRLRDLIDGYGRDRFEVVPHADDHHDHEAH